VIGPNGLGLIRGPSRLGRLTRLYGRPTSLRVAAGGCAATWRTLGLGVVFDRRRCSAAATLESAVVTGGRWSTLQGTRVGDAVPRMRWQQPAATAIGRHLWRLASGTQRLTAVARAGTVVALRLGPP
jgi:hypothetical protein